MDTKIELYHDNFQNFKRYNIPKAQLVIADIPYNIGVDAYASNPMWYQGGDNKNGESKLAKSSFFHTDGTFKIAEYKITEGSAEKFVAGIIKRGHEAVLEHCSFTVKFICDRGVSHEIVRHRMASYCQESTRYCNYGKGKFGEEITVIEPCFLKSGSRAYDYWRDACEGVEIRYFDMLAEGCTPQEARSVLPNSLKTEVVMTANIREWRHFLKLRCSPAAHPQMREVALILLDKVHWLIPVCFDDIWSEYHADV